MWIFLTGVTAPDGTEYTNLDVNVPYYIQLGDEWDEEDVKAVFISKIADEPVSVSFGTVAEFNQQFNNINFPVTSGSFARLLLKHFSPYAVYDLIDNNNSSDDSSDSSNNDANDISNYEESGDKTVKNNENIESPVKRMTDIKTGINDFKNNCLIIIFAIFLLLTINAKSISFVFDKEFGNLTEIKLIKLKTSNYFKLIEDNFRDKNNNRKYLYFSLVQKNEITFNFIRLILYQRC